MGGGLCSSYVINAHSKVCSLGIVICGLQIDLASIGIIGLHLHQPTHNKRADSKTRCSA